MHGQQNIKFVQQFGNKYFICKVPY